MKNKSMYIFIAATFALLINTPGRFVYGFTLILELNFIFLIGTISKFFVKKFELEQLRTFITLLFIISFTILFKQIFIIFQPELILTLGINLFIIPISIFIFGFLFNDKEETLSSALKYNFTISLRLSIYSLLFFLFRDIVGYGTFTFYGKNHQIFEKVILSSDSLGFFSIFASVPGALLLSGLILFLFITINKKFSIIKNAGDE